MEDQTKSLMPPEMYAIFDDAAQMLDCAQKLLARAPVDTAFETRLVEMINAMIGKALTGISVDAVGITPMLPHLQKRGALGLLGNGM